MALAGLVYANALHNPFVYDDHRVIGENRSLVPPLYVHALLFQDASRPAVNLSYAADRALWGPAPFGFHLTSVLLHALNVGLVFALVRGYRARVPRWRWVATSSALILAAHPMMSQAVGYISARSEVLCATWFLLALLCLQRASAGSLRWLGLASGCWLLAAASREVAVMFPLVGMAAHRWLAAPETTDDRQRTSRWLIATLVLAGLAVLGRAAVFLLLERGRPAWPAWELALVEVDVARRYVQMLVLPGEQSVFHEVAPISRLLSARLLGGLAVITALLAAAWRLRRTAPLASLGGLWFLLLLVPSALLVVLDRGEPMAEHRVYLASIGLFLMAGVAVARVDAWLDRRTVVARWAWRGGLVVMLVLLGARTVVRNATWSDPVLLWTEASVGAPDHWLPYIPLGESLHAAGRHNEAIGAFATAARLRPEEQGARRKLGVCLMEVGDLAAAAATFEHLEQESPGSWEAPSGLALVALARGDVEGARAWASRARQGRSTSEESRQVLDAVDVAIAGTGR